MGMTDDLWAIASGDHENFAREAARARADAELEGVIPFLLAARSPVEFEHRAVLAQDSIASIAARNGLDEDDLTATARRRYELYRQALAEDTDPLVALEPLLSGGGYGQGPERPDEHTEGPDFSGGYSEVPAGNLPGGPDPRVTAPRPEAAAPVTQATGSLRRQADSTPGSAMMQPYMPPDVGTGSGSLDMGTGSPATGGYPPSVPAGMPSPMAPVGTTQQVTSSRDPVRARVLRATAVIARANPGLPQAECERLGRRVVAEYLRQADLTDSVMGNGPMTDSGGGGSQGGSGGGHGMAENMLAGQGLKSMLPGLGGGAGAAGGAAGEAAELAPLLAL
jgi:hypothetical protein